MRSTEVLLQRLALVVRQLDCVGVAPREVQLQKQSTVCRSRDLRADRGGQSCNAPQSPDGQPGIDGLVPGLALLPASRFEDLLC